MIRCSAMCARNSSSLSCAKGETSVATISASPEYQHHCRQPGTGAPRSRSVRARTPYISASTTVGASCSGANVNEATANMALRLRRHELDPALGPLVDERDQPPDVLGMRELRVAGRADAPVVVLDVDGVQRLVGH